MPTVATVVEQIQGDYFLDYALFSGSIRHYIARTLEDDWKRNPSDAASRFFSVAIYREEYTAYEDAGALLDAWLSSARRPPSAMERLLRYKAADVRLANMFERHQVRSAQDLYRLLELQAWIPFRWEMRYPHIDLVKVLKITCSFLWSSARNQKEHGVAGFNKIKHGLLVVPTAKRYASAMPDAPAMIFVTRGEPAEHPMSLWTVPFSPDEVDRRLESLFLVEKSLRLLCLLYVMKNWPAVVTARCDGYLMEIFSDVAGRDLYRFLCEVSVKGDLAGAGW